MRNVHGTLPLRSLPRFALRKVGFLHDRALPSVPFLVRKRHLPEPTLNPTASLTCLIPSSVPERQRRSIERPTNLRLLLEANSAGSEIEVRGGVVRHARGPPVWAWV